MANKENEIFDIVDNTDDKILFTGNKMECEYNKKYYAHGVIYVHPIKEDTLGDKILNWVFILIFVVVIGGGISFISILMYNIYFGNVEQIFREKDGEMCNSNNGCYTTYVWYKGNIVNVKWDNPNTITDSLKELRRKQGEDFLKKIK